MDTGACIECPSSLNCDASSCDSAISCLSNCADGYYLAGSDCTICNAACTAGKVGCDGPNIGDCFGCDTVLMVGLNDDNDACEACPAVCSECYYTNECQTCADPNKFAAISPGDDPFCVDTCPTGYYGNTSTGRCTACEATCRTCYGSLATNCTSCTYDSTDSYVYWNGACITRCPVGFFMDVDTVNEWATCTKCHRACIHCVGAGPDLCQDPDLTDNYFSYYYSELDSTWRDSNFKDSIDNDGYSADYTTVTGVNTWYENCCADGYNSDPSSFEALNYMY